MLINSDLQSGGIYRAILIDYNNELRIYTPGLYGFKDLDINDNTSIEKYLNVLPKPIWNVPNLQAQQHETPTHPCWVTFENGDMKRPVIMGWLGKGIKYSAGEGGIVNPSDNDIDPDIDIDVSGDWELLADDFMITHYCACEKCCEKSPSDPAYGNTASGTKVTENRTIAVDTSIIPFKTPVKIVGKNDKVTYDGNTIYVAEDRGGAIKGHRIDVYIPNHNDTITKGVVKNAKVYIMKNKK